MTATTTAASDLLDRDARHVANALKIRYFPMALSHGEGASLFDLAGRRYIDFSAGWAVASLGYSNRAVRDAVSRQLARSTFDGLLSSANGPAAELAERLAGLLPGASTKVWFGLSGSDAAEAAMRLIARATGRRRFVSFIGSWHGTHDGTMALSAHPSLGEIVGGANVTKAPYPDPYRNPFGNDAGDPSGRCLRFLEHYLFETICPPNDVAALFVEAVQSDGGDIVPPPEFLPGLRALCDRHGILLVMDEIKIGCGRTGRMFGYEHCDIVPDVLLLGKSIGGGLPLSAIVGPADVLDAGSAVFSLAGNATSCAAGLAVLDEIERLELVSRSAKLGAHLGTCLAQALGRHEQVGDVRGLGMIHGVELVNDREHKRPDQQFAAKVAYRAWELGLVLFYAGNFGNVLEITPPLVIEREEIERGVAILDQAIADVANGSVSDDTIVPFSGW